MHQLRDLYPKMSIRCDSDHRPSGSAQGRPRPPIREERLPVIPHPVPKKGEVIGLLGPNGIGKTTCVSMLSGEIAPNLGHYRRKKPHWDDVLEYFAGTEVHGYLEKIAHKGLTTAIKPQYVDKL